MAEKKETANQNQRTWMQCHCRDEWARLLQNCPMGDPGDLVCLRVSMYSYNHGQYIYIYIIEKDAINFQIDVILQKLVTDGWWTEDASAGCKSARKHIMMQDGEGARACCVGVGSSRAQRAVRVQHKPRPCGEERGIIDGSGGGKEPDKSACMHERFRGGKGGPPFFPWPYRDCRRFRISRASRCTPGRLPRGSWDKMPLRPVDIAPSTCMESSGRPLSDQHGDAVSVLIMRCHADFSNWGHMQSK